MVAFVAKHVDSLRGFWMSAGLPERPDLRLWLLTSLAVVAISLVISPPLVGLMLPGPVLTIIGLPLILLTVFTLGLFPHIVAVLVGGLVILWVWLFMEAVRDIGWPGLWLLVGAPFLLVSAYNAVFITLIAWACSLHLGCI
jgi:hypothetical protein